MTASTPQPLTDRLRDGIVRRLDLTEVGAPYEALHDSAGTRVGQVRVWHGPSVRALVDVRLVMPDRDIDSVMLHVFTEADSAVPHLTSDIAGMGGRWTAVADLTPRVDLAAEPGYLDAVYPPLDAAREAALAIPGAVPLAMPLRLRAFCSPWATGVTVAAEHESAVESLLTAFADRFVELVRSGAPVVEATGLAHRDRLARRAQFDASSDEVWDVLAGLVGSASTGRILELVRGEVEPSAAG